MKANVYQEAFIAKFALDIVNNTIQGLKKDKSVVDYFIDACRRANKFSSASVGEKDRAAQFSEVAKALDDQEKAKKVHNDIVKQQIQFINKVVNSFTSIISLWGHQVDNEIHIGQVASKVVTALEKLADVQIKSGTNSKTEVLLVAIDTQKSITNTGKKAKDLKSLGKVMEFLLGRVKKLMAFNEGLENQIKLFYSSTAQAQKYKREQLKSIKNLLYNKYPGRSKKISKNISDFNSNLAKLTDIRNVYENNRLFNEFENYYNNIQSAFTELNEALTNKAEDVNTTNFAEYCKSLGVPMDNLNNKIDSLFDNLNDLSKTFKNDFDNYMKISEAYKFFVNEFNPMLELMKYIITTQKKLSAHKIELRTLNLSIKAFQDLFYKVKTGDKEWKEIDDDLKNMLKRFGVSTQSTYESYKNAMTEDMQMLLTELEKYVKEMYFKEKEVRETYVLVGQWTNELDVNFKKYNHDLKTMKVGFFQKLFKTQSYKKSEFWDKLKNIKNSFNKYDKMVDKLGRINMKQSTSVESFCKGSVTLVNELLSGYKTLVSELYEVISTMSFVVNNINNLVENGYLDKFKKFLELFEGFNNKLDKIEKKGVDLEEFDTIEIGDMLEKISEVPDFEPIKELSQTQTFKLESYKKSILFSVEVMRKKLILFFGKFLINYYRERGDEKKADKYSKLIESLKK